MFNIACQHEVRTLLHMYIQKKIVNPVGLGFLPNVFVRYSCSPFACLMNASLDTDSMLNNRTLRTSFSSSLLSLASTRTI